MEGIKLIFFSINGELKTDFLKVKSACVKVYTEFRILFMTLFREKQQTKYC